MLVALIALSVLGIAAIAVAAPWYLTRELRSGQAQGGALAAQLTARTAGGRAAAPAGTARPGDRVWDFAGFYLLAEVVAELAARSLARQPLVFGSIAWHALFAAAVAMCLQFLVNRAGKRGALAAGLLFSLAYGLVAAADPS